MNRIKTPCCSRCKINYQIGEIYGYKLPMLLSCGHDMCKSCTKNMFKKNKIVSCKVCQATYRFESENQLNDIPVHYYLVGKIWYLSFNKKLEMNRNISNLNMTNILDESSKKKKKICEICRKFADYFCKQCNEVYCKNCYEMNHNVSQTISPHEIEALDNTNFDLMELKCNQHLKTIDFICDTCQIQLCSFCAIETHREHNILPLEKYNINSVQHFNESISKGQILLKKFINHRDEFKKKIQDRQDARSMKHKTNYDENRLNVTTFISNLVGNLQCMELNTLSLLDRVDQVFDYSIKDIIGQLNGLIDDLQVKLNTVDLLIRKSKYSSPLLLDNIFAIQHTLDTSYYIAKHNKHKPVILYNSNVYSNIYQSITTEIDISKTYILGFSSELPINYTLSTIIKLDNDEILERPISSASSISTLSSNMSVPISTDEVINDVQQLSSVLPIKEITKNSVEHVIVTHINSPSDFYLQLDANHNIKKMIEEEMYKFIQTNNSVIENIEMNNKMYAAQMSTHEWHRGIVINIFQEANTKLYTFLSIDYGFTEILMACRLRNVPPSITTIPHLAYNCAIYDLKPSVKTGWTNDAYTLFNNLMSKKSGLIMYVKDTSGERIEVDIISKDNIYPLCIRDAMFYLGHGSSDSYSNQSLNEYIDSITLPKPTPLNEREEYSIVLSHFTSPHNFYFRLDDNTAVLENIMKTLESIYKPTESDIHKNYLLYTPQIGMAVAALYSIDSSWYRAKIISLPEPRMVTVFYIDFGNSETLPWNQLRVLHTKLMKTPPLSIKALLSNIYPAKCGMECDKWSDSACAMFLNLLDTNNCTENNLTAFICKSNGDTYEVVLNKHTSRGKFSLNNKLIIQGHATTNHEDYEYHENHKDHRVSTLKKLNLRNLPTKSVRMNTRNKDEPLSNDDTMLFIKQRSVIESNDHKWDQSNIKNVPGVQMTVIKVISPNEIILKYYNHNPAELNTIMNKVYTNMNGKFNGQLKWKINDLCALFIKKFGNWYRGKIVKLDTIKKTASINLYDLDEIYNDIPIKSLYILEKKCIEVRCGILHCKMDKLIPLGTSDGNWSKFSCDRLIEKLGKYPIVYFLRKGKENDISLGEIWVKEIEVPLALEPINERWININRFMIDQGFAIRDKKNNSKDDVSSSSESESDVNNSLELNSIKYTNCWLPPVPITNSQFNAIVTYVDMQCVLYLQNKDEESVQLLLSISSELNSIFANSNPEPMNVKWSEGQMVIVQYHIDNMWYRGTIIEKKEDGKFSVKFLDYGNIEICCHDNLRSTLYMTDIPQLNIAAYFSTISPMTKDGNWPISTLDYIHALIVDKPCTVFLDLKISTDNFYAIKYLSLENQLNVCQHLVTRGYTFFEHIDPLKHDFIYYDNKNQSEECLPIEEGNHLEEYENNRIDYDTFYDDDKKINNDKNNKSIHYSQEDNKDVENMLEEFKIEIDNTQEEDEIKNDNTQEEDEIENDNTQEEDEIENDNMEEEENCHDKESIEQSTNKDNNESSFLKFYLNSNEVIEGTLCNVTESTLMTLMIVKIGGIDITMSKNEMQTAMFMECATLQALNQILPDTAVAVLYNFLWRRGIISNDCNSVFLVDLGISIKLIKNNVKLLPSKFFMLPMFTIKCKLINVTKNKNVDEKDIIEELSRLLKGVKLKIVGINELEDDVFGVELYNDKEEIAYQSLIDSNLLVPQ